MTKEQTIALAEMAYRAAWKAEKAGEPFAVVQGLLKKAITLLKEAQQMNDPS